MKIGIYRHYKGKEYQVIEAAKHTKDLEGIVVYEALYENNQSQLCVRPLAKFQKAVELEGKQVTRFELVKEITN